MKLGGLLAHLSPGTVFWTRVLQSESAGLLCHHQAAQVRLNSSQYRYQEGLIDVSPCTIATPPPHFFGIRL